MTLDEHFPPCGPCLICGGPDKRHRLWDAIDGQLQAGDSVSTLVLDYGLDGAAIRAVRDAYAERRRQHRRLPGQDPL